MTRRISNRGWWLCLLLLLQACASPVVAPPGDQEASAAYRDRLLALTEVRYWELSGRLSIDDGQDGGSGRLDWRVSEDISSLDFRGALGKGAWRLELSSAGAVLHKADGSVQAAPSVEALIAQEIGWHIPVHALQWWVRGLAAPGTAESRALDPDGRLLSLEQQGWRIEFSRYRDHHGKTLPGRLDATQGERRVKLAIVEWSPLEPAGGDG